MIKTVQPATVVPCALPSFSKGRGVLPISVGRCVDYVSRKLSYASGLCVARHGNRTWRMTNRFYLLLGLHQKF